MKNNATRANAPALPVNRRTALVATGLGMVAGLSGASAAAPAQSRLPEFITAYQEARKAYEAGLEPLNDAEEAFRADLKTSRILLRVGRMHIEVHGRDVDDVRADLRKVIDRAATKMRSTLHELDEDETRVDRWEANVLADAEKAIAEWETRRADLTRLEVESNARCDAEDEALYDLLAYRPVSDDDKLAKAAFLGPLNRSGDMVGKDWVVDALLESLIPDGEDLPEEWRNWAYSHAKG